MGSEDEMPCEEAVMTMEEDGCATPTRGDFRIPAASAPPPPPRKKPMYGGGKKRGPPKNGYFQAPDDLELLFAAGKRQA